MYNHILSTLANTFYNIGNDLNIMILFMNHNHGIQSINPWKYNDHNFTYPPCSFHDGQLKYEVVILHVISHIPFSPKKPCP